MQEVWIGLCWNEGEEPVVTVFSTKEPAEKYVAAVASDYDNAKVEQTYLYSSFIIK